MSGQVIEYDYVAGHERGAQHLVKVSGEDVPVEGPAPGHGRWHERGVELLAQATLYARLGQAVE